MADVESLELQIKGNASGASRSINTLIKTLEKLEKATAGGCGLSVVSKEMEKIQNISLGMSSASKEMRNVADSLADVAKEMQKFDAVTKGMQNVASTMQGVTDKMQNLKVSSGRVSDSNNALSISFKSLGTKIVTAMYSLKRFSHVVASWINESNEYVENLNLFTVAMGEYAEEAKKYAEQVGEVMGIDPSEWMRNQGVFMTLATGFGVAGDRAATMSQQLTQLGYDLSSFYNISVEEAMQKLKSGFAGELEPLRNLGYDLSKAKLEAIALSLGIDKSYDSMTQAEKAQLRYYAVMTQVTTAQGDMARTLDDPANQLRVLRAQLDQAARALGDLFIPMLKTVLPYLIAATKVVRILANTLYGLFYGKSDADESGLKDLGTSADSASDSIETATENASKLRKTLLGIDELNVMSDSSGSGSDDSGGWVDFELPIMKDWLNTAVGDQIDAIVNKMKAWLGITDDITSWSELMDTRFGDILKTVGLIGISFAAWKISKSVHKFVTKGLPDLKELLKSKSFQITMGVTLAVTGLVIGAGVIKEALTEGLQSVNVMDVVSSAGLILSGGALIGKAFGKALSGAAVGAIVVGVAGLGVGLYDAIKNELDITNALTIAFSAALIGAGIGYLVNGALGAAAGAAMGVVIGGAMAGATWLIQNVESTVEKVFAVVSAAALAVGAILAFTGVNIPLGIGLMAVGAVSMGSQIAMNTDALSDEVKGVIAVITAAVSTAMLAVGAILAFTGVNIPLGIALMAGGALTMGASIIPKWDTLSTEVQNTISSIMAIVGAAGLAIGAILAFSGVGLPLGIGLMAVGAASLGTAAALNWDGIVTSMRGTLGKITAMIGGAAMVIGLILLFTGVGTALGLGLLLGGAASLGTAVAFNWDSLWGNIKTAWNNLLAWWEGLTLPELKIKMPHFTWDTKDATGTLKTVMEFLNIPAKIPSLNVKWYGNGGLPPEGQMFVAREAGPELVGTIGNRSAVVNNDQIVSAVSKGVYQAVVQAMGQSGGQTVEAKVNDKVLFEVVVNRNRQETMRTGYNPLLGGV